MDACSLLSVILGLSIFQTVYAQYTQLRCIECVHIAWDPSYVFDGSQQVYDLLRQRYNPACGMEYPLDRRAYEQEVSMNQQNNPFFLPNNYQVTETVCRALSNANKCNYVHGDVEVYLRYYDATLRLNMHVRNCIDDNEMENMCYARDTNFGYHDVRFLLQNNLAFLSNDLRVNRFVGYQCVCNSDLCSAEISSASRINGFSFVLVLLLVSYFVSRRF